MPVFVCLSFSSMVKASIGDAMVMMCICRRVDVDWLIGLARPWLMLDYCFYVCISDSTNIKLERNTC